MKFITHPLISGNCQLKGYYVPFLLIIGYYDVESGYLFTMSKYKVK